MKVRGNIFLHPEKDLWGFHVKLPRKMFIGGKKYKTKKECLDAIKFLTKILHITYEEEL